MGRIDGMPQLGPVNLREMWQPGATRVSGQRIAPDAAAVRYLGPAGRQRQWCAVTSAWLVGATARPDVSPVRRPDHR